MHIFISSFSLRYVYVNQTTSWRMHIHALHPPPPLSLHIAHINTCTVNSFGLITMILCDIWSIDSAFARPWTLFDNQDTYIERYDIHLRWFTETVVKNKYTLLLYQKKKLLFYDKNTRMEDWIKCMNKVNEKKSPTYVFLSKWRSFFSVFFISLPIHPIKHDNTGIQ